MINSKRLLKKVKNTLKSKDVEELGNMDYSIKSLVTYDDDEYSIIDYAEVIPSQKLYLMRIYQQNEFQIEQILPILFLQIQIRTHHKLKNNLQYKINHQLLLQTHDDQILRILLLKKIENEPIILISENMTLSTNTAIFKLESRTFLRIFMKILMEVP